MAKPGVDVLRLSTRTHAPSPLWGMKGGLEDIRLRNCLHVSLPAPLLSIIQKTPVCVEIAHYLEKNF